MTIPLQRALEILVEKNSSTSLFELQFVLTALRDNTKYDEVHEFLNSIILEKSIDNPIGKASSECILELILNDLDDFLKSGKRTLEFLSEDQSAVDEMVSDWLSLFNEYPNITPAKEVVEIKEEVTEHMGLMNIWTKEDQKREEYVNKFSLYFGEYKGFLNLIKDVYFFELEEDLM